MNKIRRAIGTITDNIAILERFATLLDDVQGARDDVPIRPDLQEIGNDSLALQRLVETHVRRSKPVSGHGVSSGLSVELSHATFRHVANAEGGTSEPGIHDVSATLQPGTLTLLCGGNGAGKSTLMSLISGIRFPTSGSVRIGGIDTRAVGLR